MWAVVVGITMQFFINMEIERYTLVTGESVFMGMTRKYGKWIPIWFLLVCAFVFYGFFSILTVSKYF